MRARTQGERPGLPAEDGGGASVWMIAWMITFMIFGGVSVDTANGWRHRAVLQATADSAALAAAMELPDETAAVSAATAFSEANMSVGAHGDVLDESEVLFGVWDSDARVFTAGATPVDAVQVTVRRAGANGNALPTHLLRLAGFFDWNVGAKAVAQRYIPKCLNDGLFARGSVSITSNNNFSGDICVHGQTYVSVRNNNDWTHDVSISMPDIDAFQIPIGGWSSNENIEDILVEEWFDPKLVDRIDEIIAGLENLDAAWTPSWVDMQHSVVSIVGLQHFNPEGLEPGRVYVVHCGGPNNLLNMGNGATLSEVVLIADCRIALGNNAAYSDVVVASTAGDPDNLQEALINVGQGTILGADDGCSFGGGVVLISTASIDGAAGSSYHGVQVIAAGDVSLAAGQGAIEGLQGQAGGDISFTANNVIGNCAGGVDGYSVPYFRLVD